jgi:xylan 1,4-beta-xylosidase
MCSTISAYPRIGRNLLRAAGLGLVLMGTSGRCAEAAMLTLVPSRPACVTGADDLAALQRLAAGVGWEFESNAETSAALKRIGIRAIRCINVDPLPGEFDAAGAFHVGDPGYLRANLETCRAVGATPHVIIAQGIHPALRLTAEDIPEAQRGVMGNQTAESVFGPKDWTRFQRYCEAYFDYVMLQQGFREARFEVANEPDIGGAVYPRPPKPANGSRALYEGYFELYRNVAAAASRFEAEHAGVKVRLGGPALAWAYTFRYGELNWADRFVEDCATQKVKLDFLSLHFYGNLASLNGQYQAHYPSFVDMLKQTRASRDRWCPGVPIWMTEWGPSYQTCNEPKARVNADHIGAAWCMAFLNTMLENGIENALYLVTTDLRQPAAPGGWDDVWGWPSLFVNPNALGKAWPKAPFHVLEMVSRLEGQRIAIESNGTKVGCFATAQAEHRCVSVILWNYAARIPEGAEAVENAVPVEIRLAVRDAGKLFGAGQAKARRWLVSADTSNAYGILAQGGTLDARTELQEVQQANLTASEGELTLTFVLPPSGVSLIEFRAE